MTPWTRLRRSLQQPGDIQSQSACTRFGKPNYERVNKLYFQYRTKMHAEGSLESVVNKLVKNWEVESHHISNPHKSLPSPLMEDVQQVLK